MDLNPIALVIFLGGLFAMASAFLNNPVKGTRFILGAIVALCIGFGVPLLLMHAYEPSGVLGLIYVPIWLGAWMLATKVWLFIAGEEDE